MDFMKLFKSLEELLYEIIVMLVFFPKTLWLTFRYPQRMMDYADTELGDVQSEQYNDTLSPPVFLMMCVAISYLAERAMPGPNTLSALPAFLQNPENLLAMRVLVFSLFPLMMSLRLLHGLKAPLDRDTLRAPFFAQCFIAAPTAMMFGFSQSIRHVATPHSGYLATLLLILTLGWYLRQQANWFHAKLDCSLARGWGIALSVSVTTLLLFFVFAAFFVLAVL
jgi:hypothetical protein